MPQSGLVAACPAATLRVAPTFSVWVPPAASVPVGVGLLVNVVTVMVLEPLAIVVAVEGSVIA